MKKMEIFDPAMCCSSGLCGPAINPELIRVAAVIENLKKNGIKVKRHNLSSEPQAFIQTKAVAKELNAKGTKVLPITIVDGKIVKEAEYLTNKEFLDFLEIGPDKIQSTPDETNAHGCNCGPHGFC